MISSINSIIVYCITLFPSCNAKVTTFKALTPVQLSYTASNTSSPTSACNVVERPPWIPGSQRHRSAKVAFQFTCCMKNIPSCTCSHLQKHGNWKPKLHLLGGFTNLPHSNSPTSLRTKHSKTNKGYFTPPQLSKSPPLPNKPNSWSYFKLS